MSQVLKTKSLTLCLAFCFRNSGSWPQKQTSSRPQYLHIQNKYFHKPPTKTPPRQITRHHPPGRLPQNAPNIRDSMEMLQVIPSLLQHSVPRFFPTLNNLFYLFSQQHQRPPSQLHQKLHKRYPIFPQTVVRRSVARN